MRIKPLIQTLNAFFSGTAGKGYNWLYDEYGLDPKEFSKLPKAKKQELIKEFLEGFRNCLANDLVCYTLADKEKFDFEMDEPLFNWLVELGEVAATLLTLVYHYGLYDLIMPKPFGDK